MPGVDLVEAREVERFPPKQLDGRHAGDVFLKERIDARDPAADDAIRLADVGAEPLGDEDDERQDSEGDERQAPIHPAHHDHDADQQEDIADHGHHTRGEEIVQHIDVRGHACHQTADWVAVVVPDVEPLQMAVDGHPQVEHDALPRHLEDPGLAVLGGECHDQDAEVQRRQSLEPRELTAGDVLVDRDFEQVGLGELRRIAHDDGDQREADLPPVRAQVLQQPPHQTGVVCLTEDVVVVEARHDAASSSSSNCFLCNSAYRPFCRINSSCVPRSAMRP